MGERKKAQGPRLRLRPEQRDEFLEILGQTGNRRFAAEAIGVEPRLMDQRRRFDKLLDRQWEAALDQADRRLAGASGPFDCVGGRELNVIRRGRSGRLMIVASGPKRWNRAVEDRFFAALSSCGNIAAAARAVGFGESCIWQRRRKWPSFAAAMDEVLDQAELRIEFRLALMSSDLAAAQLGDELTEDGFPVERRRAARSPGTAAEAQAERTRFDPDLAMRYLKWRRDKRSGGGRRRPEQETVTTEQVRDEILRRLNAIRRHREKQQIAEGWTRDETGYMIPPGWVRAAPPEEE